MTLSDFVRLAADAYWGTGNPGADSLKPYLLASLLGPSVTCEPSDVKAVSFLAQAVTAGEIHPLAEAVGDLAGSLRWLDVAAMQQIAGTRDRHAYTEIVGPGAPFASDQVRFGLYLQAPDVAYPNHEHAAEEFYFVLSGTASWRKGDERFALRRPGELVHHLPYQVHATTTHAEPLLAMWAWSGEISSDSYRVEGVPGL